jgi:hypothetical protein
VRDLEAGRADPAGRTVHEHRLALPDGRARLERELGGQVVQRQRRRLLEADGVRQREDAVGGHRDQVRPAAVRKAAGDPVTDSEIRPLRHRGHRAGQVHAELEGQLGLELVLTPAQQQVGPGDPDRAHLDEDLALPGGRLVDLHHLDSGRTIEPDDLHRTHGALLRRGEVGGHRLCARSSAVTDRTRLLAGYPRLCRRPGSGAPGTGSGVFVPD